MTDHELRKLLDEATPRPWRPRREPPPVGNYWFDSMPEDVTPIESTGGVGALGTAVGVTARREDAALIAAAVNALPGLLDELDRARAEALEEAARVAEAYEPQCEACPRGCASAIRALKERR